MFKKVKNKNHQIFQIQFVVVNQKKFQAQKVVIILSKA